MNVILLINYSIILCALMFSYQAVIDLVDGRRFSRYRLKKKNIYLSKISVVVEFNGSRDEFVQQISDLKQQDYDNLEVVILVGSKYSAELKYILHSMYKNRSDIKVIGYERNQSLKRTLDKCCSGSLIILLNHKDKLSKSFFEYMNISANLKAKQMIFYPAHQFRLDNSLLSLLFAQAEMFRRFWIDAVGIKINLSRIHSGVVYRHKIIQTTGQVRVPVDRLVFISRKSSLTSMFEYLDYKIQDMEIKISRFIYILAIMAFIILLIIMLVFLSTKTIITLVVFVPIAYVIVNLFMQFRLRGYLLLERLNLIAVAPIVIIINSLIIALGLLSRILKLLNKRVS